MAINIYYCDKCGTRYERYRRIADDVPETVKCPQCGERSKLVPSAPSIVKVKGGTPRFYK